MTRPHTSDPVLKMNSSVLKFLNGHNLKKKKLQWCVFIVRRRILRIQCGFIAARWIKQVKQTRKKSEKATFLNG